MSKLYLISIGLTVLFFSAAFVLARFSQTTPHRSQFTDRLKDCPDSPNCVSTESRGIEPIPITDGNADYIWTKLQETLAEQGGQLMEVKPLYLWATFKTPVFGFIDDLEARMDLTDNVIHLRSASRVGYYDFGTNLKRLQNLKAKMQAYLNSTRLNNTHE
ncbi:MAG: DUF1499 domain-containing protein [Gammaproteobacteria bacterium]